MSGDMITGLMALFILMMVIFALRSYLRKAGCGCCSSEKKIRVRDKNRAHYPFSVKVKVQGMHCSGCDLKIENAFNQMDGTYVKAHHRRQEVVVLTKQPLSDQHITSLLNALGYQVQTIEH